MQQLWSQREKPEVEEIYKLMISSENFAKKAIKLYERELKNTRGLDQDELDSYTWDQLRLADEDKDERRIEEAFKYFKSFNQRNPLRMRAMFNQWHGIE